MDSHISKKITFKIKSTRSTLLFLSLLFASALPSLVHAQASTTEEVLISTSLISTSTTSNESSATNTPAVVEENTGNSKDVPAIDIEQVGTEPSPSIENNTIPHSINRPPRRNILPVQAPSFASLAHAEPELLPRPAFRLHYESLNDIVTPPLPTGPIRKKAIVVELPPEAVTSTDDTLASTTIPNSNIETSTSTESTSSPQSTTDTQGESTSTPNEIIGGPDVTSTTTATSSSVTTEASSTASSTTTTESSSTATTTATSTPQTDVEEVTATSSENVILPEFTKPEDDVETATSTPVDTSSQ